MAAGRELNADSRRRKTTLARRRKEGRIRRREERFLPEQRAAANRGRGKKQKRETSLESAGEPKSKGCVLVSANIVRRSEIYTATTRRWSRTEGIQKRRPSNRRDQAIKERN